LHAFDFPLDGLRCEAYFYDAVLQGVTGPPESRRQRQLARLDRALATNYQLYYEYHMAHMLRDRIRAASVTR
jgi:hypothetical protein